MGNATHRQRWETRGPALSWVSRCAPAACGEGVTLPYGKPLPLEAAVEQEQEQLLVRAPGCWSARARTSTRTRAPTRARAHLYRGTTVHCTGTILVEYTSHQHHTSQSLGSNIHRICKKMPVLNVAFTPKTYVALATRCELSSKHTVL